MAGFARVAVLGRCPRCGSGVLFNGLLDLRPVCLQCGLDYSTLHAGDGPAVFAIFIVGAVAVAAALFVEVRFAPPLWVHAVLWPILVLPLAVWVMRVAKAALVALQWRHSAGA